MRSCHTVGHLLPDFIIGRSPMDAVCVEEMQGWMRVLHHVRATGHRAVSLLSEPLMERVAIVREATLASSSLLAIQAAAIAKQIGQA